MSIEAMKLALEALENYTGVVSSVSDPNSWTLQVKDEGQPARNAIEALRAAIEQAEKSNAPREVEIEFTEWMHPQFGVVPVDPKTPLILKAKIREAL